jgi:hypothetical protein
VSVYGDASGWQADPTQILRWVVLSLVIGKDGAIRRAAREGRVERREVAAFALRETMSSYESPEDLVGSLENVPKDEDPESDIETLAGVLGVGRGCAFCGTTIVDPYDLAEAAIAYYGVREKSADGLRERLKDAIEGSAVEMGSMGNRSICSHCAYVLSKD